MIIEQPSHFKNVFRDTMKTKLPFDIRIGAAPFWLVKQWILHVLVQSNQNTSLHFEWAWLVNFFPHYPFITPPPQKWPLLFAFSQPLSTPLSNKTDYFQLND